MDYPLQVMIAMLKEIILRRSSKKFEVVPAWRFLLNLPANA